jgi:hypothetical protein
MRYASGFFSGKFLHQVCVEVLALSNSVARKGRSEMASELIESVIERGWRKQSSWKTFPKTLLDI